MELSEDCWYLILEKVPQDLEHINLTCSSLGISTDTGPAKIESFYTSIPRFLLGIKIETTTYNSHVICGIIGGNVELLKYLIEERKCLYRFNLSNEAVYHGQLQILKYLREAGHELEYDACTNAARGGHLDVLKYLREIGCPWNQWTCAQAASGGHLDVLKYLHENGCPWNGLTCRYAADRGHTECLQYARDNGCPES
jgi:hypothetical protein